MTSKVRLAIHKWPEQLRPRERLLNEGPQALSTPELLAIFLRTGNRQQNAIDLANELLQKFGGLRNLLGASKDELSCISGIGIGKWSQLQAVYELVKRSLGEHLKINPVMHSPGIAREYLEAAIGQLSHEVFACLFLNPLGELIDFKILFRGTTTQTTVYPREIAKEALLLNAVSIILVHNHPQGNATPSQADIDLTKTLIKALKILDIEILDHCIVSNYGFFSFLDAKLLFNS
ncbi:MAG: DNA repair protein RadC [Betaproteobacteria bacterium]|jgi:DNA repair protein RadC